MAAILLDHNLLPRLGNLLQARGHAVMAAFEAHLENATDSEILRLAGRLGLTLLTCDEDFIDLHAMRLEAHAGILHLPQVSIRPSERATLVAEAIHQFLSSKNSLEDQLYRLTSAGIWERWHDEGGWTVVDV